MQYYLSSLSPTLSRFLTNDSVRNRTIDQTREYTMIATSKDIANIAERLYQVDKPKAYSCAVNSACLEFPHPAGKLSVMASCPRLAWAKRRGFSYNNSVAGNTWDTAYSHGRNIGTCRCYPHQHKVRHSRSRVPYRGQSNAGAIPVPSAKTPTSDKDILSISMLQRKLDEKTK